MSETDEKDSNNNNNNVYLYSAIPTSVLIALHRRVQNINYNDRCLHVSGKYDKQTNKQANREIKSVQLGR